MVNVWGLLMGAGLRVYNDQNFVQIDGEFKTHFMSQKGSGVTDNKGSATITLNSENLIIFVSYSASGSYAVCTNRDGNQWTFSITTWNFNEEFTWYVFTPLEYQNGGAGLRVFNEQSQVVFDSNQPPLSIAYYFDQVIPSIPPPPSNHRDLPERKDLYTPPDIPINLRYGRRYAVFAHDVTPWALPYKLVLNGGNTLLWEFFVYMPINTGAGINFRAMGFSRNGSYRYISPSYPSGSVPKASYGNNTQRYWIIDVTGL